MQGRAGTACLNSCRAEGDRHGEEMQRAPVKLSAYLPGNHMQRSLVLRTALPCDGGDSPRKRRKGSMRGLS